ncbi:IS630 family transposase [Nostoc sp. CHAB 5844]|nr:IS630 family transposase [Nostoc sp. CHAB 5844]
MPVSYSKDLRERVIMAYVAKEGSQRQLAQRFKVSLSFVRNRLRQYRTNGQIEAKRRGGYQKPTIINEHLSLSEYLVKEKNDLLLRELCDRYEERTGIKVSITTMHRAVEKLGLRVKKSLYASEQDSPRVQELRHDYRSSLDKIDVRNLVFVDEAGLNLSMSRLFARAVDGERAVGSIPGSKGGNISLVGALNLDGLIAAMTVPGSINTEVFLTYVTQVLAPQLWKGAIVVMDNLKIHHAERVRLAIESVGAKVKFLPPYSPDLSPIELCWSKLKTLEILCNANKKPRSKAG